MKRDSHTWMWAEALGLLERADRMNRQFCGLAAPSDAHARWEPPVDVLESPPEVLVTIALPGVAPERIELHLDNVAIAVTAERVSPVRERTTVIRRLEIPYGRFARRIALPDGRYELLEQACVNGCLQLRLRRF